MKTPLNGCSDIGSVISKGASNDSSFSKDLLDTVRGIGEKITCEPQPLRAMVIDIPPRSSCPPFFGFSTFLESKIAPAQVPQTGFLVTKSLSGPRRPEIRANKAIVVLSKQSGLEKRS